MSNVQSGRVEAYDADLSNYFDTIPHAQLLAVVRKRVVDQRILGLILSLRRPSRLVIVIEHDLAFIRRVAEHVVVLEPGGVITSGTAEDVLHRPEIMDAYLG